MQPLRASAQAAARIYARALGALPDQHPRQRQHPRASLLELGAAAAEGRLRAGAEAHREAEARAAASAR